MTSSLFSFCPQSVHFHRHGRTLVDLAPQNKAPSPPN